MHLTAIIYILFGFVSLVMGVTSLIFPQTLGGLDHNLKLLFSSLFIFYGVFRLYAGISSLRKIDTRVDLSPRTPLKKDSSDGEKPKGAL
jgi:hypothetical protein